MGWSIRQICRTEREKTDQSDQCHIMSHQHQEIKQKTHETFEEFAKKTEVIFTELYPDCPDFRSTITIYAFLRVCMEKRAEI